MRRTYTLLLVVFALVCLLAFAIHRWGAPAQLDGWGVAIGLVAAYSWAVTAVLALGTAGSVLGCRSPLQSGLQSLGLTSLAVTQLYRGGLSEGAGSALLIAGFLLMGIALFVGRRRATSAETAAS